MALGFGTQKPKPLNPQPECELFVKATGGRGIQRPCLAEVPSLVALGCCGFGFEG